MKNDSTIVEQKIESKFTFWKLLSNYKIEIPIIQRDYAQGRLSDNASAIRNELLDSIHDALVYCAPLDFDFVYGSVDGDILYPLDGQQRLTTFFLLHWYLSEKEKRIQETRETLSKFSYTTRISSRDFCDMLVGLDYSPEKDVQTSDFIKNENGYFRAWNNDPTIKAMLVMLDAIHEKFFDCGPLLDRLINEEQAVISFNYLPMEHYALTDDLYIKMNARGKALSIFENFKAKFIQHLRGCGLPYDHFEDCIDGKWTDLLWDYRSVDNTIDKQFMNLFCYFTEMIFLWVESPRECESPFRYTNIRKLVGYYDSEEKVLLLYSLMDLWESKNEAKNYLEEILCINRTPGKVRLFDGQADIFSDIVNGNNVILTNKILLFSIMRRLINLGKNTDKASMLDYVRLTRNFLIKNRFFSTSKSSFTPDFRFGRNGIPYTSFIGSYLTNSENPYEIIKNDYSEDYEGVNYEIYRQESIKASIVLEHPELKPLIHGLEDLAVFRGSIFNILEYAVEYEDESLADDMENLFTPGNSDDIIPALLSVADYGIKLGSSFLGERFFYGNKDRWYEVLTYSGGSNYTRIITDFIRQYQEDESETIEGALKEIAEVNLKSIDINDWRYCLVKYPSTISDYKFITNRNLVFAFEKYAGATILHRMNGKTLNAFHVVPEYIEVAIQLGSDCDIDSVFGKKSEDRGKIKLSFRPGVSIMLNNEGDPTLFYFDDDLQLVDKANEKYNATDTDGLDTVERLLLMAKIIKELTGYGPEDFPHLETPVTPERIPLTPGPTPGKNDAWPIIHQWCRDKMQEGKICFLENSSHKGLSRFTSADLDEVIPYQDGLKSGWNNGHFYSYEVVNRSGRFKMWIAFSNKNAPEQIRQVFARIMQLIGSKPKKDDWEWWTIFSTAWFSYNENTTQEEIVNTLELQFAQVRANVKRLLESF